MINVEQIQQEAIKQSELATASANRFAASAQAIAAAHVDYGKTAFQDGSAFIVQLSNLRTPDEIMAHHSEYLRIASERFAAESKKILELYGHLAEQTYTPFESLLEKMGSANSKPISISGI